MPPLVRQLPKLIAWFGLALLAAFTWADKGPSRALQWPWYLYAQVLVLLPAAWLTAHGLIHGRIRRFGRGLDWALLAFAAAMIAAAAASPFPDACFALLPTVLAPLLVAYGVMNWLDETGDDGRATRLAHGGAIALVFTAALMLLVWLLRVVLPARAGGAPWLVALGASNDQLLGHTVYVAGIGLLTTAWLAGLAGERKGLIRLLCLAGALVGAVLILSTGRRSGFTGLGAWLIWFLLGEARRRGWSWPRTLVVAVILGIGAAALVSLHPRMRVIVRQWRETGTINPGDRQRLAMAEFGGLVVREHPLLGIGPGATPLVYPQYRARLSGGVESALQLHSTPVQWAADAGLCGLGAAVWVVAALWWRRRRASRSFAAGALLAYTVLALTDYQLDVPVFAFAVGGLLGLLGRTEASPRSPTTDSRTTIELAVAGRPAALALAGLVALFVFTQQAPWRARAAFAEGMEALHQGEIATFERGMANARKLDPKSTYFRNLEAAILADIRAYPLWFPPVDLGADRMDRALALYRESLTIDPSQELPHTHLAWLLLAQDPQAASQHFRTAARLIPDKGGLYLGLGLALLAQNRPHDAAQALALEIVNDPTFVTSPEWIDLAAIPGLASASRRRAATILEQLADRAGPHDPLLVAKRTRYTAAVLRWLDGDSAALATAQKLAESDQCAMLDWLAGNGCAHTTDTPQGWQLLAVAGSNPSRTEAVLQADQASRRFNIPEVINAIATALRTDDRRNLLLLQPGASPQLTTHFYRERTGYGLLLRNLDAPPPRDPHLGSENRIVRDFLSSLFPEKGYLPAPLLAAELARLPE